MDIINEYLKRTKEVHHVVCEPLGIDYWRHLVYPSIKCSDGYSVSVQAGRGCYSSPYTDDDRIEQYFTSVELGFPNYEDSLIMEYAEDEMRPTDTVYGYVPVQIVCKLIEKHGGIIN